MNLLGHALLSFDDEEILCGNMMGDFVKGKKVLEKFPEKIRQGILLHRKIDHFTDHHPAVIKAINLYRPDYRLYSGAIIDIVFDHFLANDPKYFPTDKSLLNFSHKAYQTLKKQREYQSKKFQRLVTFLEAEEILFQYRNIKGFKTALDMLCKRMKYANNAEAAWATSMRYYNELNQYFFTFIEDIVPFVKEGLYIKQGT